VKLQGDYHTHTRFSDGKNNVIDMVRAAKEKGLREFAITDHSINKIINGFRGRNFDRYQGEIESARAEMPMLVGIEANVVSTSGRIDLDRRMEGKTDIVLCGVHVMVIFTPWAFLTFLLPNVFFRLIHWTPQFMRRRNTNIVTRAIRNNDVDVWTHPNRYVRLNVLEVARVCVERGTLIELNGKKISFRPIDFEKMRALGAKFIVNSDAHNTQSIASVARVEEFLKNCDWEQSDIINLNQTYTEYKNAKSTDANQDGNPGAEKPKRGIFGRRN